MSVFNEIIKSSKALDFLEGSLIDSESGHRHKPPSAIEIHLAEQAANFLSDQLRSVDDRLAKAKRYM